MLERIKKVLNNYTEIPSEELTPETDLIKDLDLTSLDVIDIVLAFEDEFDIEIPDRAIRDLLTVGDIEKYLNEHV